jgi:hypothetical protein
MNETNNNDITNSNQMEIDNEIKPNNANTINTITTSNNNINNENNNNTNEKHNRRHDNIDDNAIMKDKGWYTIKILRNE